MKVTALLKYFIILLTVLLEYIDCMLQYSYFFKVFSNDIAKNSEI